MAPQTTVLITGANRGIGRTMTASLLLRPSTTVIATVREPTSSASSSLKILPTGPDSNLILLPLDMNNVKPLSSSLDQAGITTLDTVISNAGLNSGFDTVEDINIQSLRDDFEVNVVGTFSLFQVCQPLLSSGGLKKFIIITSSVGSIKGLEVENMPGVSYGASKAAANWVGKKLSVEYAKQGFKIGIVHPGWVKTNMGQRLADAVGFPEPPMEAEESARLVLERIDALDEQTSGKYLSYDGQELPW